MRPGDLLFWGLGSNEPKGSDSIDSMTIFNESIESDPFELLVLSDIGLPDLSGFEVTRLFRAFEKESGLTKAPVIGLTAHSIMDTEDEALAAGMNHIINKPLRPDQVHELIKKYELQNVVGT